MSREDINGFDKSLKELRQELSRQSQLYADMKESVDQCIKAIWSQGKVLEDILNNVEQNIFSCEEKNTSDCSQPLYHECHFSAQEECFILLLCAEEIEKAHMLYQEMRESGYQHAPILELYLAEKNKQELLNESLLYLGSYTGKNSFLLLIRRRCAAMMIRPITSGVPVLAACLRNVPAALDYALLRGSRIGLLCAGRKGHPAVDRKSVV